MLDYTELKEEGGRVLWPPMEELPSINVLGGDPIGKIRCWKFLYENDDRHLGTYTRKI